MTGVALEGWATTGDTGGELRLSGGQQEAAALVPLLPVRRGVSDDRRSSLTRASVKARRALVRRRLERAGIGSCFVSLKKDMRRLVEKAERQGWRIDDRGKLWLCKSPDGTMIVTVHKTPSDQRALHNTIARLRRGGFDSNA